MVVVEDRQHDDYSCRLRDAYGFPVHPAYTDLHRRFTPIWAEEEAERTERWERWLQALRETDTANDPQTCPVGDDAEVLLRAALAQYTHGTFSNTSLGPFPVALLKQLRALVQMGVPMSRRAKFWSIFLNVSAIRVPGQYQTLVMEAELVNNGTLELKENEENWMPQIEKDLHRTFPDHPLMDRKGRAALRRILAAYSRRNPDVGYCQGLNFLGAAFLLLVPEEDAFWYMVAMAEDLLTGYFDAHMVSPQVDSQAFGHLLRAAAPRLAEHLESLHVDAPSATSAWFLVAFLNSLPIESCLRVWDVCFFERSPVVLFRVALALMDIYGPALLETDDSSEVYLLLQSLGPMSFDASGLIDTACIGYGYIKDAALKVLRDKYRPGVLKAIQNMFNTPNEAEGCFNVLEHPLPVTQSRSHCFCQQALLEESQGNADGIGKPSQAQLTEQQNERSLNPARRRTQSAIPLGEQERHGGHFTSHRVDLYAMSSFVPNFNAPSVAAAYRIASTRPHAGVNHRHQSLLSIRWKVDATSEDQPNCTQMTKGGGKKLASKKASMNGANAFVNGNTIDLGSLNAHPKPSCARGSTTGDPSLVHRVERRFTDGGALLLMTHPQNQEHDSIPEGVRGYRNQIDQLVRLRDHLLKEVDHAKQRESEAERETKDALDTAESLHKQVEKVQLRVKEKVCSSFDFILVIVVLGKNGGVGRSF